MKKKLLFFPIICVFLFGCENVSDSESVQTTKESISEVQLPKTEGDDTVILYNRFKQKFVVSYNTETCKIVQESNVENYVQYEFNSGSNYYTAGHSITNGFEILYADKDKIESVYKLEDAANEAIFPLATDGEHVFFVKTHYDSNNNPDENTIVSLNENNELEEHISMESHIDSGVIVSGKLYFTTYEIESDTYDLYSLSLEDMSGEPVLEKGDLVSGELYEHNNQLYLSDDDTIYCGTDSFKKSSLNYFFDENQILVQIHPNESADLALDVIDTNTKKVIGTAINVIDFEVKDDEVIVYCDGEIEHIELGW